MEEAQQFDLHWRREVADLIQEQGPTRGPFDESLALFVRPGKRSLLVPEQLALDQVLRDGAAVDRDEGLVFAIALAVDGIRDHFLACAALAQHQHRRGRLRHLADHREDRLHLRLSASIPSNTFGFRLCLQLAELGLEFRQVEAAAQDKSQLVGIDRLAQEIVGTSTDRPTRILFLALAGNNDHFRR